MSSQLKSQSKRGDGQLGHHIQVNLVKQWWYTSQVIKGQQGGTLHIFQTECAYI